MTQYIDKDALVAEIEKELNTTKKYSTEYVNGKKYALKKILSFLDTIEVKEVDLEKEIDFVEDKYHGFYSLSRADIIDVAKHFFELGLLSTITEEDCKLIWNIGDDLPYMPEEEFFKELLKRYKAQKGE